MAIKRKSISVTVSRTVQVQQFQPSVVSVTETADVPEGMKLHEAKAELYESASKSVQKFMRAEIAKYKPKTEEDDD